MSGATSALKQKFFSVGHIKTVQFGIRFMSSSPARHSTKSPLRPDIDRAAAAGAADGLIALDASGTILMANAHLCALFGYDAGELIGQPVTRLLPGCEAAHVPPRHIDLTGRSAAASGDLAALRKDGRALDVRVHFAPAVADGEPIVIGTITDTSEEKRRDRIRDEFVSTLSHELRTPVTAMNAALALVLASGGGELPQPVARLIAIAHANCQRLIRMTSEVLDLGKLDAGQMPFHFRKCDAAALLNDAIALSQPLAADNKITLRLTAPNTPVMLYVDPDRFSQLVTNLLSNAIKFSPPHESILVTVEARGGRVHITVRDHGPGIPPEFRPHVFEAFTQLDSDHVRKKGGSGLGLSIARRIVTRMHGQIGFDDAPGGGTIFHVDLPDADYFERWEQALAAEDKRAQSKRP